MQAEQEFKEAISVVKEVMKVESVGLSGVLACVGKIMGKVQDFNSAINEFTELEKAIEVIAVEILVSIDKKISREANLDKELREIEVKVEALEEIIKIMINSFKRAHTKNSKIASYYKTSKQLVDIMAGIVRFSVSLEGEMVNTLLSFTPNDGLNQKLNEVKASALKLVNFVMRNTSKSRSFKLPASPCIALYKDFFPQIVATLLSVTARERSKLEQSVHDKQTTKLTIALIQTMRCILDCPILYELFINYEHKIVLDICFVLIRATEREKALLEGDPAEFVSLGLDVCGKQKSKVVKTEAAKLLEGLCDSIDGVASFCFKFCCESIRFVVQNWDLPTTKANAILGPFIETSVFLLTSSKEELLETSLTVLTVISYLGNSRLELIEMTDATITENFIGLFGNGSSLIRCRVALITSYLGTELFVVNPNLVIKMIEFLIHGLEQEKEQPAFSIQCGDALNAIIDHEGVVDRVKGVIAKFFPHLSAIASKAESATVFFLISNIITAYKEHIEDSVVQLLSGLVARIKIEQELFKHKAKRETTILNQCWNVIESICKFSIRHKEHKDTIEKEVLPLFNYLASPAEIDFDDRLLQVLTLLIKSQKCITENMLQVFPFLIKLFESCKCTLHELLEVFNYYLFYGKLIFSSNNDLLEAVLKVGNVALNSAQPPIEINNIEGALLFQMLLQNISSGILNTYIPKIVELTLKRLDDEHVTEYLRLQLMNVILCAMCNNGALTVHCLGEKVGNVIERILYIASFYKQMYDVKVLIIGCANIIVNGNTKELAEKYHHIILDAIVLALQEAEEVAKKRMTDSKKENYENESELEELKVKASNK
eukprot:TRINITY_DN7392_c0_g1_i17.p1 TRINITY_DN7392_c0_g1~~TRINITY_DN7392_c0_g1_i17.p1  ORF type:complete len:832 (+),score=218.67 TRINITY_DN7392_c0_g1_i17:572-3067(+)